jgi:hypothetical protein
MAKIVLANGQSLIVIGNNSARAKSIHVQAPARYVRASANDLFATVTLSDGRKYRHEFQHGSTYLSNSSRTLKITAHVSGITITDFAGKERAVQLK